MAVNCSSLIVKLPLPIPTQLMATSCRPCCWAAGAHRHRAEARRSMAALNLDRAHRHALAAQKAHATESGRRLLLLASWLRSEL